MQTISHTTTTSSLSPSQKQLPRDPYQVPLAFFPLYNFFCYNYYYYYYSYYYYYYYY